MSTVSKSVFTKQRVYLLKKKKKSIVIKTRKNHVFCKNPFFLLHLIIFFLFHHWKIVIHSSCKLCVNLMFQLTHLGAYLRFMHTLSIFH